MELCANTYTVQICSGDKEYYLQQLQKMCSLLAIYIIIEFWLRSYNPCYGRQSGDCERLYLAACAALLPYQPKMKEKSAYLAPEERPT